MDSAAKLKQQIQDAAGDVQYTYIAHWCIVNRLRRQDKAIKIAQIVLTATATGGFLSIAVGACPMLTWLAGLSSAIALALNMYTLNFDLPEDIKQHTAAANELWDVKRAYASLLIDFDGLDVSDVRVKRDELAAEISRINKTFPGTDDKSFGEAKAKLQDYRFDDGEAAELLHIEP